MAQSPSADGGGTVTNCSEAALRAALAGGGHVTFACDGTIQLLAPLVITNDSALDGTGRAVVLSGNRAVRVLEVAAGARLALTNLTIADGVTNRGAGLLSRGHEAIGCGCTFRGNEARGADGLQSASGEPAAGGAIWSAGVLTLINCAFETNRAVGGNGEGGNCGGGEATGGAIHAEGSLTMSNVVFLDNECQGGRSGRGDTGWGPNGANALGGAVYCTTNCAVSDCMFRGNEASAGYPGGWRPARGEGRGGALALSGGIATVWRGRFESNSATGRIGLGGGIWHGGQSLVVSNATFSHNAAAGDKLSYYLPAEGGPGAGGGLFAQSPAWIWDSMFEANECSGGEACTVPVGPPPDPIPGGPACGGGLYSVTSLVVERCTWVDNRVRGGYGFRLGGPAYGAGLCITAGSATLVNITLCSNTTSGGGLLMPEVLFGQAGPAYGGGICLSNGTVALTNCTLWGNAATGVPYPGFEGEPGIEQGGGVANVSTNILAVHNSIIAGSPSGGDVFGAVVGDPNLIGGDPRLLLLADNGGLTPTMALRSDSPAIDTADPQLAPATDQRGLSRPFGNGPDLGAFERTASDPGDFRIHALQFTNGQWQVGVEGPPGQGSRMQASTNLADWTEISTNSPGPRWFWVIDPVTPPPPIRFYRVVSP